MKIKRIVIIISLTILFLKIPISAQSWTNLYNNGALTWLNLYFVDETTGWVVGGGGVIMKTTDSGQNWTFQNSGTLKDLYGIWFLDSNIGFVCGVDGTILKTTNGGTNWSDISISTFDDFMSISFKDASNGLVTGEKSIIRRTTDGGTTWNIVYNSGSNSDYDKDIEYKSYTAISVGSDGGSYFQWWRTLDNGDNWIANRNTSLQYYLNDVSLADINNGIAYVAGDGGKLLKSTDSGLNWNEISTSTTENLNGVSFLNENYGIIVGNNVVKMTNNGGTTWITQNTGYNQHWSKAQLLSSDVAYIIGQGRVMRTDNAALPVELTSLATSVSGNKVFLNWKTSTEVNNYGFEIERLCHTEQGRSVTNWEKIGFVAGHGNSNSTKYYSFVDENPKSGKNKYRLKQIDFDGKYEYSEVVEVTIDLPAKFALEQNYPNPFNPTTTIRYSIPNVMVSLSNHDNNNITLRQAQSDIEVTLKVHDILGREVATLVNEKQSPGNYEVKFDGSNLPSGIYFYRINANKFSETKKLIFLK